MEAHGRLLQNQGHAIPDAFTVLAFAQNIYTYMYGYYGSHHVYCCAQVSTNKQTPYIDVKINTLH